MPCGATRLLKVNPRIHQLFALQTQRNIEYIANLGDETAFEQQLADFSLLEQRLQHHRPF